MANEEDDPVIQEVTAAVSHRSSDQVPSMPTGQARACWWSRDPRPYSCHSCSSRAVTQQPPVWDLV